MKEPADSGQTQQRVLVWDLPARVSHWGFSLSLTTSLVVGFKTPPESPVFKVHILAGLLACWFLGVRFVLGLAGSKPMRWSSFFNALAEMKTYAREVWRWRPVDRVGLNAGSALFALALYIGVIAAVYTGFDADLAETWHGRLAYGCVLLIGAHLAGLSLHALRHRKLSPLAMVHGESHGNAAEGLRSAHTGAGWLLLALGLMVAWLLWRSFDEASSVLQLPLLPEIPIPVIQKG